jgi:hypothetical protein
MAKLYLPEWLTIISAVLMILLVLFGAFITGFKTIFIYLLILTILLIIYILSYVFESHFNEYGEKILDNNEELLKLEKDHSALIWAFANGIGIAFLIPGLSLIQTNPTLAILGLILLIVGELIYSLMYYPRYFLLLKRIKINSLLNTKKK